MGRQSETYLAGEVHCLNCGARLAEVVRGNDNDTLLLRRARHQVSMQVEIVGGRLLRCRRCGGRALAELLDDPIETTQAESRGKCEPLASQHPKHVVATETEQRLLRERLPLVAGMRRG